MDGRRTIHLRFRENNMLLENMYDYIKAEADLLEVTVNLVALYYMYVGKKAIDDNDYSKISLKDFRNKINYNHRGPRKLVTQRKRKKKANILSSQKMRQEALNHPIITHYINNGGFDISSKEEAILNPRSVDPFTWKLVDKLYQRCVKLGVDDLKDLNKLKED